MTEYYLKTDAKAGMYTVKISITLWSKQKSLKNFSKIKCWEHNQVGV